MIKSCGGCQHWVKWKTGDGLCELKDAKCPSDHVCEHWKGSNIKGQNE